MRKGIYSALITAIGADGHPNREGAHAVVRYNIEVANVDGLYVNGSTGENFIMSHADKLAALKYAAEAAKGDCGMIAQVGCNVLEEALELAKTAADLGYEAVSAVTPTYYQFSAQEVVDYYTAIANGSPLPVILYYIPKLSGTTIGRREICELLEHKNIAGVKFTNTDFYMLERMRSQYPEKALFSGFDEMFLSAAALGVDGAIGSTFNVIGRWPKKVLEAVRNNDLPTARLYQGAINGAVDIILDGGLFPTLKQALILEGVPVGECRPPMAKIGDKQREAAKRLLAYRDSFDAEQK